MKAKCIKSDPLGNLAVGEVYECKEYGRNVIIDGSCMAVRMAVSKELFEEMFDIIKIRELEN